MTGSIDGSSNDYFIVAVILTTVVYMFFPIIKIITNHGNLFERKRAKKIALWNSIVVGAIFCIVTSVFIGPWSAAPAFFYYWINSAILTERSDKTVDDGEADKNPTQQPYRCASCGRMGPYDGDCPDCGSGEIVFLDPETVQAKEDDIDTACKPTPKETAVNDMQREECDTSPDIPAPAKPKIDILSYVTSSVFNPAMRVDTPKESDTSTDITDTSDSTVNASEPMVSKSNVKESNNHSKPIYCTRCGQLIDPETKRCTGCGRRYLSLKPIIISLSAVALIGGIVCFFCFAVPEIRYQQAISYYKQGEYLKANELLKKDLDYKNSRKYLHTHKFSVVKTIDETCDTDGSIISTCICGKVEEEVINASHSYSKATCTEPKTCRRCGATSGEPFGHSDDAFCSRCGKRLFETQEYTGTDSYTISGINLPSGKYKVTVSHSGYGSFSAKGISDIVDFDAVGSASQAFGVKAFGYNKNAKIEIECNGGSWAITIEAIK